MTAASSAAKLTLSVSSAAANGNALLNFTAVGAGLTKTFNLPIAVSAPTPPDTTAPTISQRLPAEGMTGVSPDSKISLTFSEPMNTSAVQVLVSSLAENADLGTATWTNSNKTVTFAPVGGLKATAYTISATGADEAGNDLVAAQSKSGFIVSLPLDTTPPQLSSSQPVDLNSLSPAAGAGFSLQFSEPMAAGTLGAISFKQNVGLVSVPVTCAWLDASHVNVTCKHPSVLSYSSAYAVVISAAAKDIAGNALTVTVVQYYTAANADTVQPSILGFPPSANSSGVAAATVIAVTFSEPMDKASTQTAFAFTSPAGVSASYKWNPQGTVLTMEPSAAFAYGQTVTWNVSSVNAHDVSGNSMQTSSDLPHSFKVTQIGVVKLYAVGKTLDGAMYPNSLQADYQLLFSVAQACCSTYSRAFMSFDLSKLPNFAAITKIQAASLNVYQNQNAPSGLYGASGNVLAENIYYPILFPTYFNAPTISAGATNVLSTSRNKGSRSMDVTAQLVYDYKNRASLLNRSQWRLRFAHEFASVNEFAYLGDNTSPLAERPDLNVTYFYP